MENQAGEKMEYYMDIGGSAYMNGLGSECSLGAPLGVQEGYRTLNPQTLRSPLRLRKGLLWETARSCDNPRFLHHYTLNLKWQFHELPDRNINRQELKRLLSGPSRWYPPSFGHVVSTCLLY